MNCHLSKPLEIESFNSLELIGIWEQIHNPDCKGLEFETFRKQAGLNSFSLTPRKWIEATGAIGFQSRAGRYGGGNSEGMNAEFIHMALPQGDRLKRLNAIAIRQMQTLTAGSALRQLEPPKGRKE